MDPHIKRRITHRFKIISGQIKGLEGMINKEVYCIDIINQSLAIREALTSLEKLVLQNHLSTHVVHQMSEGHQDQAIKEILSIYKFAL